MKNILIIKHGALGDVVRTSYLLEPLKRQFPAARVTWITKTAAAPLVEDHPLIDRVIRHEGRAQAATLMESLSSTAWDWVLSLDDELDSNYFLKEISIAKLSGTFVEEGEVTYTDDVAEWFDMGLISKLGKAEADRLKVANTSGHAAIFARMLGLGPFEPASYVRDKASAGASAQSSAKRQIGLNLSAGRRWPAKTLRMNEAVELSRQLRRLKLDRTLCLLGGMDDLTFNQELKAQFADDPKVELVPPGTLGRFAALIAGLEFLITSDSMALHLAISQGVPSLSFFSATSADEIDTFGRGVKVRSTAPDYCSYRPDADNSTITAARLITALAQLSPERSAWRGAEA